MIEIEKIVIKNYRKFFCETITLDNQITAIAGANNSGKTSLVELMSNIFIKEKRNSINIEDMNSKLRLEDEAILEKIIKDDSMVNEEKIEELQKIHKKLNKITIGLVIKYDDDDDLENFSSYLADVDITKRNFYFIIEYEYTPVKEKDIIDILKGEVDFKEIYSYLQSKIYYCDEHFQNKVQIIDKADFYNLFNYHCVYAVRKLADTSEEKQNFLSKHLLKTVKNNHNWKENLKTLIKSINTLLNQQNLSKEIDTITLQHVKSTLVSFSKTNGGNTGKLGIDFRLENKDIEKVLLDFIHIYFEQDEGVRIKEQKQGLGYSNLIYLLLEGQIFSEKIDAKKVNLLVFEEPEAHLHPQMENIFIRYVSVINKTAEIVAEVVEAAAEVMEAAAAEAAATVEVEVTEAKVMEENSVPFQMLITTHSSEMTKIIGLNNIRVLRSNGHAESKVYDLHSFMNSPGIDRNFYEKFFQFNMVEMVFADKLILFEGDAERLLFKYLISNMKEYENLSSQYISYIQVGGAYAHKYLELINFLEIKTLIFTDIDYEYNKEDIQKETDLVLEEVIKRETSNETIKKIVGEFIISEIFKKSKEKKGEFLSNNKVCLKFQTDTDGYARTLEDALLHKLLDFETVFSKITKKDFQLIIEDKQLLLSNTNKAETSLRDRIDKLNNKTDSMYALIESGNINNAIPNYIEEGLDWLKD
ncbi:AAA family ATPase [Cytobacillus sp. FSL M8-0252]|uniref:AAA family ATPase n=1 Tax=Cytobacillus sp. FSL M8-0252 TaxID=2921621 RepID=UPI0030F9744A